VPSAVLVTGTLAQFRVQQGGCASIQQINYGVQNTINQDVGKNPPHLAKLLTRDETRRIAASMATPFFRDN
jgi:hypothetical protein